MSKRQLKSKPEHNCAICRETHPRKEMVSVKTCRSHSFCKDSMSAYLLFKIKMGEVKIRCPAIGCKAYFREKEIEKLTTSDGLKRYKRVKLLETDDEYRECSKCSELIHDGSVYQPEISCKHCNHKFCFVHGDAHPDMDCLTFLSSDIESEITIARTTKKCPRLTCPNRIEKYGGCHSMICRCGEVRQKNFRLFVAPL